MMSDIVNRLRSVTDLQRETERSSYEQDDQLALEAADTITRLTAENEKLKAALRECEAELNAYYRMEYAGSHPYSQKELAQAMASNPATVALLGSKP
jgi:hypothetical protein